jgi:hypothetical protein
VCRDTRERISYARNSFVFNRIGLALRLHFFPAQAVQKDQSTSGEDAMTGRKKGRKQGALLSTGLSAAAALTAAGVL